MGKVINALGLFGKKNAPDPADYKPVIKMEMLLPCIDLTVPEEIVFKEVYITIAMNLLFQLNLYLIPHEIKVKSLEIAIAEKAIATDYERLKLFLSANLDIEDFSLNDYMQVKTFEDLVYCLYQKTIGIK